MLTGSLDPITNREDWTETIIVSDQNGSPIDISSSEIVVAIKDRERRCVALSGSKSDGTIAVHALGTFSWTFPASRTRALMAGTYDVGCTITTNGVTSQLLVGSLPVIDGVVA